MSLEHEDKPECKHETQIWFYGPDVIATNPLICHKICALCGRVEDESPKPPLLTDKQIDEAISSIYKRHSLRGWWSGDPELRAIAQAQLDADWEYFQGVTNGRTS